MNCNELENVYWKNYILIEKEFKSTLAYVYLSEDNFETYSNEYIKLILQIGSEIDVVLKSFCQYIDNSFNKNKMPEYIKFIKNNYQNLIVQRVKLRNSDINFNPWNEVVVNEEDVPSWWTIYNKVKHERNSVITVNNISKISYKFANLKNVLYSLGALYQILLNYYLNQAKKENRKLLIPLPGSRIFVLSGDEWTDINFVLDQFFYVDYNDGTLHSICGNFEY